jgi:hypothetical protein
MFPTTLTWALVESGVSDLLGQPVILAAIVFVLSLRFGPRVVKAMLSATRGR